MAQGGEAWREGWSSRSINGVAREVLTLDRGATRIEAIELDMADQWDFMEIAGTLLDNEPWVSTALLATSVIAIDGVPLPSGVKSRDAIRAVLRRIGTAGIDALGDAFERRGQALPVAASSAAAEAAAVGN